MDNLTERLTVSDSSIEFLYTLYYYDQADNLIKTVPPEGVHVIDNQTTLDAVAAYRNNVARYDTIQPGFVRPNHTMVTNYRYNTLNQVIQSYQPDYDSVSYVYYDILSRPVLSQDGKQKPQHKYSYTDYDDLGRIKEVGQVTNSTPFSRNDAATLNFITEFLNNGVKSEVTFTWYDRPVLSTLNQTHLRNRIAAVSFCPDGDSLNPESATHYSYDIHGNVKKLIQDIPALSSFGRRFTVLDYEYDLISGNVNRVWYQKSNLEQFSHRYRYDADNRITHVYTSNIFKVKRDSTISQERLEARYFYLPTGALSRAELGHKQIQGVDYAYTLQGWLKDINGYRCGYYDIDAMSANYDIGEDAFVSAGNQNRLFAHDGFSTSIQYYTDDYEPISGGNFFNEQSANAVPLYNGNISALTTSYYQLWIPSMLKLFRYDKLNRIKSMQTAAHSFSPTGWESVSDNYSTQYSYDWNGNLLFLQRKKGDGQIMHNIDYYYPNNSNRLNGILATGLLSGTYQYDAIGNLVRDNAEGLTVGWNARGKVDSIGKSGNLLSKFRYGPMGQRQVKEEPSDTIYYIHDATGNVMCIYQLKGDTLRATERYIYGSKRLGMLGQQVWIFGDGTSRLCDTNTIGHRTYELTDHLGNVTATILDRKWLTTAINDSLTYMPHIVSYTDYYPFGYPISERSSDMGGYRYFFNGQEADNEVLGDGVSLSATFWQYDTRLGRRWNVDPVFKEYESPYACFAGNPVWFADRFGADTIFDDDVARKDFLDTYQEIVDLISGVERKAAAIRALAAQRNWTEKKLNREIGKLYEEKEYNTLLEMKQGFEEIMSNPDVLVSYSTDILILSPDEGGKTKHIDDKNVTIYYRPGKLGSLTHETRHAWGVIRKEWSFRGGYDTFDELWAFTWQSVIDADAVKDFIDAATNYKYPNPEERWTLTLEEAVNYFYTQKKKTNIIISNVPIPEPETLKNNIRKAGDYIRSIIGR